MFGRPNEEVEIHGVWDKERSGVKGLAPITLGPGSRQHDVGSPGEVVIETPEASFDAAVIHHVRELVEVVVADEFLAESMSLDDSGVGAVASWGECSFSDLSEGLLDRSLESLRGKNPPG